MLQLTKHVFTRLFNSGFIYVFVAQVISYLVAFGASIAYAHLLSPNEFGIYSFCYTIITFCLLVNGFGAASGVLQFVSQQPNPIKQVAYVKVAMRIGIVFNLLISIVILIYANYTNLPIANSKKVLIFMAFFPVGRLYIDVFQAYLRATMQNKLLARFSICNNSIILAFNIGGILYNGIWGLITTTYLSYLVMIILSTIVMKLPNIFSITNIGMAELNWRKFFSYSIYSTIGNAFAQLIFNLDILILGYLIKDALLVADYKVATIIPFALNFIPGVIMTFFYPILARNTNNVEYMLQLKHKIVRLMLAITIPASLILFSLAHPLITLIFGAKFTQSILPFQILILGFPIAAMRILYGNFLASMGKARFAMGFNCLIALVNIIVTYTLVEHYATVGAAAGIVIIYLLAAVLAGIAVSGYLKQS